MTHLQSVLRRGCGLALASLLVGGASAGAQAAPQTSQQPRSEGTGYIVLGLRTDFTVGIRTGAAVAKLMSDQDAPSQGRIAPTIGLYGEARFSPVLSLVADVLYTEYGGDAVNPIPMYGADSLTGYKIERVNLQTRAIEVPLQLKVRPSLGGQIMPYVTVGASRSWFLGTTSDNFVRKDSTVREIGLNMDPVIQPYDWAGLGGIGLEARGRRVRWSVEIYARFGVTDFNRPRVAGMTSYTATATGVKVGLAR